MYHFDAYQGRVSAVVPIIRPQISSRNKPGLLSIAAATLLRLTGTSYSVNRSIYRPVQFNAEHETTSEFDTHELGIEGQSTVGSVLDRNRFGCLARQQWKDHGRDRSPMFAAKVCDLQTSLMLLHDPNDLLFRVRLFFIPALPIRLGEKSSLHRLSFPWAGHSPKRNQKIIMHDVFVRFKLEILRPFEDGTR